MTAQGMFLQIGYTENEDDKKIVYDIKAIARKIKELGW